MNELSWLLFGVSFHFLDAHGFLMKKSRPFFQPISLRLKPLLHKHISSHMSTKKKKNRIQLRKRRKKKIGKVKEREKERERMMRIPNTCSFMSQTDLSCPTLEGETK